MNINHLDTLGLGENPAPTLLRRLQRLVRRGFLHAPRPQQSWGFSASVDIWEVDIVNSQSLYSLCGTEFFALSISLVYGSNTQSKDLFRVV